MTVRVMSLQSAVSQKVTSFSDSLLAPDEPTLFGNNWYSCGMDTAGVNTAAALAARVNRVATGMQFSGGGAGSLTFEFAFIPNQIPFYEWNGKAQFVQWKFISDTSAGGNCNVVGIGSFCNPNTYRGYILSKNRFGVTDGGVTLVSRPSGATISATHAIVANDVIRLETRPMALGVNELKILINGATVQTINDNSLSQIGVPIAYCGFCAIGAQVSIYSTFSCGLL